MANVNIVNNAVAIGNTAVASLFTTLDGSADDMSTVQVVWKNHLGTTLSDETWSGSTVSTTGTNGETVEIEDVSGDGTYEARLQIVSASWPAITGNVTGTLEVTIVNQAIDGSGTDTEIFTYQVGPTSVSVDLSTTNITNKVRRLAGLDIDVMHVAGKVTDTRIDFGKGIVYDILEAKKNGADMVNGVDYSWNTLQTNVLLLAAPAVNDHHYFRIQKRLSGSALQDYIDEATRYVLPQLQPYYEDSDLVTYPTVSNMICARAVGRIKEDMSEGIALESAHYRSGHDLKRDVDNQIKEIQSGRQALLDGSYGLVDRALNSIMGGFRHADGAYTSRRDLLDRAQQHTGLFVQLTPEVIPTSER